MSLTATVKRLLLGQRDPLPELGRNQRCWCGSGRKYKSCHLDSDERRRSAARAASAPSSPQGMF